MHKTTVASLSTDLALAVLVLAVCIQIIKGDAKSLIVATLLSLTLLTIKLSGIVFGGMAILFIIYRYFMLNQKRFLRSILLILLAGVILIAPYIVRNIILSGWPFFPLPAYGLKVPWAMPLSAVKNSYDVLRAFSIWSGPEWTKFVDMSFWQWFPDWFLRNLQNPTSRIFFLTLFLFLIGPFIKVFTKKSIKNNVNILLLGLASFLNIIYILIKSPDLRYAEVFVWIFFASVLTVYTKVILENKPKLKMLAVILTFAIPFFLIWPIRNGGEPLLKSMRWVPQPATEEITITPIDGSPSFKVSTTLKGSDQCGNADLPCTPWPSNNFKEIVPGDISKGFAAVK
jgi:hypothetical protein